MPASSSETLMLSLHFGSRMPQHCIDWNRHCTRTHSWLVAAAWARPSHCTDRAGVLEGRIYLSKNEFRALDAMSLLLNSALTELDVSSCSIGEKGAQSLARALKHNSSVTKVSHQYIQPGFSFLSDFFLTAFRFSFLFSCPCFCSLLASSLMFLTMTFVQLEERPLRTC